MDRPMCSALLRFGSFPHHNEVGAGKGVSEKVLAVGFCLGSGLFGSCNSN